MFGLYRQSNNDAEFKYLHVYKRIDTYEKWAEVRRTLDKAKETYKPDVPTPGASDGRSDGNKCANKGKHAVLGNVVISKKVLHTRKIMVIHSNERGECCPRTLVDRKRKR